MHRSPAEDRADDARRPVRWYRDSGQVPAVTRAVVFAYSEVGVRCVRELLAQGVQIPLLFTHADDPGESQWFGSVRQLAEAHGIRVETPDDPNTAGVDRGGRGRQIRILCSRFTIATCWTRHGCAVPRRGALNMHGSLLPKYRGRAPVHWAILNGETETGASLHYMVEKPDAGALVDQQPCPSWRMTRRSTCRSRWPTAAAAGAAAQSACDWSRAARRRGRWTSAQGSYFGRRRPEDGRIDWRCRRAAIHDLVRAVAPPFPGAFTEVNGCRLAVLETRVDAQPARYPAQAPCLYAAGRRVVRRLRRRAAARDFAVGGRRRARRARRQRRRRCRASRCA